MITLAIIAGLLVAAVSAWLLIEAARGQKRLACAIPLLMAWPLAIYFHGSSLLGYATRESIAGEFDLISSYADEREHAVFALVRLAGERQPRLYAVTGNFEQQRKAVAAAQTQVNKGVPIRGRMQRRGLDDAGEFVFYALPPSGLPDKN